MNDRNKFDFSGAYTFAFWSLKDCPIPSDLDLNSVKYNIREAFDYLGYCGNVEYRYYDGEDLDVHQLSWEIVRSVSAFWPDEFTNLVVISKNIPKTSEFFRVLRSLNRRCSNVLLVQPPESGSESMFQTAESVRACIKQLDGGDPMIIYDDDISAASGDDINAASEADCDA